MRHFETGATRDSDEDKYDFEGFLSPIVLERYAEYMHKHRLQADGEMRDSDNWQKGIPKTAYIKSLMRHVHDLWLEHRGYPSRDGLETALCAIAFNAFGYLYEVLKDNLSVDVEQKDQVCESCKYQDNRLDTEPCKSCVSCFGPDGWESK